LNIGGVREKSRATSMTRPARFFIVPSVEACS
jgi:hypothetical protein